MENIILMFSPLSIMIEYRIQIFQDFLSSINNYLHVISKEGPEIYYLNLRIIQSPQVIIDKSYNIKDTILTERFPDTSKQVNSAPTPSRSYSAFELALAEALTTTPDEFHHLGSST